MVRMGCVLRRTCAALHEQPLGAQLGVLLRDGVPRVERAGGVPGHQGEGRDPSDGEQLRLRNGAALYRTATIVTFVLFCILPQHMRGPYGWFVERIIPTVQRIEVTELLREAALGDPDAQNALGFAYADGQFLPVDPAESARWHLAAAGQDHRGSQVELCRSYFSDRADTWRHWGRPRAGAVRPHNRVIRRRPS